MRETAQGWLWPRINTISYYSTSRGRGRFLFPWKGYLMWGYDQQKQWYNSVLLFRYLIISICTYVTAFFCLLFLRTNTCDISEMEWFNITYSNIYICILISRLCHLEAIFSFKPLNNTMLVALVKTITGLLWCSLLPTCQSIIISRKIRFFKL